LGLSVCIANLKWFFNGPDFLLKPFEVISALVRIIIEIVSVYPQPNVPWQRLESLLIPLDISADFNLKVSEPDELVY
jgi:hypothetical protein